MLDDTDDEPGPCKVPRLVNRGRDLRMVSGQMICRPARRLNTQNIVNKLANREHFGKFHSRLNSRSDELPFRKIPERLRYCLRDIVPFCYLDHHVFMGLTACGQFLLSYTVSFEEEEELTQNYSFTNGYKYKLFFWIYRPNAMLQNFYQVCLFDDHGVDSMKTVSITQWVSNPRLLVVHGASDCDNEETYLSYVAVPKLGCRDCSEIRKSESDENCQTDTLCIRCNLTIHSKYTCTDSDPLLVPRINFNHPDYLVTVSDGFIHALHVALEKPAAAHRLANPPRAVPPAAFHPQQWMWQQPSEQTMDEIELNFQGGATEKETLTGKQKPTAINSSTDHHDRGTDCGIVPGPSSSHSSSNNKTEDATTMVAKIIADFAECQTKANQPANRKTPEKGRIFFSGPVSQQQQQPQPVRAVHRDGSSGSGSNSQNTSGHKVDSYEFSEETEERCEKISLFRKKRLADKKYEFSEDNSENIVPFNRVRSQTSILSGNASLAATAASGYLDLTTPHAHRGSPSHGFRSPCGSPIGNRCLRSPGNGYHAALAVSPSTSPAGASGMFSPKHQSYFKRFNSLPPYVFSSPKRPCGVGGGEPQLQEILPGNFQNAAPPPILQLPPPVAASPVVSAACSQDVASPATDEKMVFSKKVVRHFVEETDAASVITNEEDDCISPGYHLSLPMEVHGSCYSVMQMVSAASAQKLQCATVRITQNSFDMDQFTYFVANHNCEKHDKKYGVFYDWACELVALCKYSGLATCVLAVHFTATDKLVPLEEAVAVAPVSRGGRAASRRSFFTDSEAPPPAALLSKGDSGDAGNYDCINCSSNLDCVFHRKHYQCCCLFTWDVATGEWTVLDYGELVEMGPKWRNQSTKKQTTILRARAKKMANHLRAAAEGEGAGEEEEEGHLRVLDSCNVKSKDALTDRRNCIEFYRGPVAGSAYNDLSDFLEGNSSDDETEEEQEEEEEEEEEDD